MTDPADVFSHALGPDARSAYRVSRAIAGLFPGKAVIEGLTHTFDLDEYAAAGRCEARLRGDIHAQFDEEWGRACGLWRRPVTAVFDVRWESHALSVACASWREGFQTRECRWVIADDRETARRFAEAVCAYCNAPHDAVLVFHNGCWTKSASLWREIQASSFDDLVLAGDMTNEIRDDFGAFLAARDEYARLRAAAPREEPRQPPRAPGHPRRPPRHSRGATVISTTVPPR